MDFKIIFLLVGLVAGIILGEYRTCEAMNGVYDLDMGTCSEKR